MCADAGFVPRVRHEVEETSTLVTRLCGTRCRDRPRTDRRPRHCRSLLSAVGPGRARGGLGRRRARKERTRRCSRTSLQSCGRSRGRRVSPTRCRPIAHDETYFAPRARAVKPGRHRMTESGETESLFTLDGRVAVVTGGASGIGAGMAILVKGKDRYFEPASCAPARRGAWWPVRHPDRTRVPRRWWRSCVRRSCSALCSSARRFSVGAVPCGEKTGRRGRTRRDWPARIPRR